MVPHLLIHAVGVALCFVGMVMSLFGLAGARSPKGKPTALGVAGIVVLIVGGAAAVAPLTL